MTTQSTTPLKSGPAPVATTLGILGLAMTALLALGWAFDGRFSLRINGPIALVVAGVAIVGLGAFGLMRTRSAQSEAELLAQPVAGTQPVGETQPEAAPQPGDSPTAASASSTSETVEIVETSESATHLADEVDPPTS